VQLPSRISIAAVTAFALTLLSGRNSFAQAPGPMSKGHSSLDGALDCVNCHEGGFGVPDKKCLGCHEHHVLRDRIKAGKGFHADPEIKAKNCKQCHAEHIPEGGPKIGRKTTVDWRPFGGKRNFEHQRTGWPLEGAHRFQECEACHTKKYKTTQTTSFLGLRSECTTCHGKGMRPGLKGFENPHEFTDAKMTECTICHTFDNRKVPNIGATKFDHDKTAFPLTGNHQRNACTLCHKDIKTFKLKDKDFSDCKACHKDSHRSVISASRKCQQCHSTKTKFQSTKFDHGKETHFALHGRHAKNQCADCHKVDGGNEKPKMVCSGCHKDIHRGRFGKEGCDGCHPDGGPGWKEMRFAHDTKTKFALTGKHSQVYCTTCHRNREPNNFERFKTTNCADCHRHQEAHCGQFGLENCGRCHIRGGDRTSKFDHNLTRFPLERAHAVVECQRCHKPAHLGESAVCKSAVKYTGLDPACLTCHEDIHRGELGRECNKCHTAGENFKTLVFDHNRDSRFALTGFHQLVECDTCHPKRKFKLGDIHCIGCHKNDDAHAGALGDDCAKCHETSGGAPKFDHDLHTNFRREGVHKRIECERCHFLMSNGLSNLPDKFAPTKVSDPKLLKSDAKLSTVQPIDAPIKDLAGTKAAIQPPGAPLDLKFRAVGRDCGSCHPDPHRVRDSLVLDCGSCHGFNEWLRPPKNGYHEGAGLSLTGAHAVVQCPLCHVGTGSLRGRARECGLCHVQDDIHAGSFGNQCGKCHEQTGWLPSTFTHMDTAYVLEGVHRMLDCRSCHRAGNYFIGNKCYHCHLNEYRNSLFHAGDLTAPSAKTQIRIASGLGQMTSIDCGRCHNQFTFSGGSTQPR
jgi:hypothetical protein